MITTVRGDASSAALGGERLKYLRLWDLYGALLTETQQELCEKYFLLDLSLSEIAEEKGISRQAVSDALKKSRELLDGYEEKLRFDAQNTAYSLAVSSMMTDIIERLEAFKGRHPELAEEMDGIIEQVKVGDVADIGEE